MRARLPRDFDPQPSLSDGRFALSPLVADDRDALYAAASDPLIWEQHPARTRHERAVFDPYFDSLLASGATLVNRDTQTGAVIGCSRYYPAPDIDHSISIGFTFLSRAYWGGPANFAMKRMMLDHAFATLPDVWLHIGPDNWRSRKGTEKIGATFQYEAEIDVTGSNPPVAMACYRITRDQWAARLSAV